MAVTPIQDFISTILANQTSLPSRVTAPVSTAAVATSPASNDNALASSPSDTLLNSASLYNSSVSIAQLNSFLDVAQGGTQEISSILQNLQALAQQATGTIPNQPLDVLDNSFQQLLSEINQVAANTQFGGTPLLTGSLSASQTTGTATEQNPSLATLELPDLTTNGLFGNAPLNLQTQSDASTALNAVTNALGQVGNTLDTLDEVQSQTGFAAASVETAMANSTASASVLSEADLAGGLPDMLDGMLSDPGASSQAQTGNMLGNLLNLING